MFNYRRPGLPLLALAICLSSSAYAQAISPLSVPVPTCPTGSSFDETVQICFNAKGEVSCPIGAPWYFDLFSARCVRGDAAQPAANNMPPLPAIGDELENEGSSGSIDSHWDRRGLLDDIMAAAGGLRLSTFPFFGAL